jgi:hypothetical protein
MEAAMRRKLLLLLPLLAVAGSAHAYDPIVLTRGWQQLAHDRNGDCQAEARGNGQLVYIYATGLGADVAAHYYLTNGDMSPIDWDIRADGNGEWARYYIPYRPTARGGDVNVAISTDTCSLTLAFQWQRGTMVTDVDGTRHLEPSDHIAADFAGY